ncbi:hypothetical protein CJF32_00010207 [Rutstroemia sp. NJR-2017a WRK4]|nr:hypothetical protein CJF32_00010207 [Rutstroemia sp. NJR-2017a WRK4]
MLDLNITINELQNPLAGVSSVAVNTLITDLLRTERIKSEIFCLHVMGFQKKGRNASDYISSLLMTWTEDLAYKAGGHIEVLRKHRLHIREDSRTRGVRPDLTIVSKRNSQQLQLVSVDQRMQPLGKGLTCIELYNLLALAAKMYRAQPFADDTFIYQVDTWSIHFHGVQRITANIPFLYMQSMIQGRRELVGKIEIWRGPSLNFFEDAGRSQILQGIFERCELPCPCPSGISTVIQTPIQNPRKRKAIVQNDEEVREKRRITCT